MRNNKATEGDTSTEAEQKPKKDRKTRIPPHERANNRVVLTADRDEQILKLKLESRSQVQIAKELGISQTAVSESLHRSLRASQSERKALADLLLQQELDRLDHMAVVASADAIDRNVSVKERMAAMDQWRKLMERRQKLLGMEVTTVQVRHEPLNPDEIEKALQIASPIEIEKIRAGDTTVMAVLVGRVTASGSNSAAEVVVDAVIEEEF